MNSNETDPENVVPKDELREPAPVSTKENLVAIKRRKILIFVSIAALVVTAVVLGVLLPQILDKETPYEWVFEEQLKLPLFSKDITQGYSSQEELAQDLTQFSTLAVNQEINGMGRGGYCHMGYGRFDDVMAIDVVMEDGASPSDMSSAKDTGAGGTFDNVNSYETNNQEESVDTADLSKSDGTYLYTAYGDTLMVIEAATGELKSTIQMPEINITKPTTDKDNIMEDYYYPWEPKPNIAGLLLEGDRLALIVSGYGFEYTSMFEKEGDMPILCDYMGTRILVYDINDGEPILLSKKDVHGSFRQGYSIDDGEQKIGHIVTQASIDTWTTLREPLSRWNFQDLNDEEYKTRALELAGELIPTYVDKLVAILGDIDINRLSLFAESVEEGETLEDILPHLGVADSLSTVVSFVMEGSEAGGELDVSVTGTTQPGYWGYVYANDQMIVLADRGWAWVEDLKDYAETTFLMGFSLDGASSKHEIVGSTRGTPLNSYSIDLIRDENMNYLRMATTMRFWSPIEAFSDSSTWNEIVVLGVEAGSQNELERMGSIRLGKPNEVFTAVRFLDEIAYAVTFEQRDPFYAVNMTDPKNPTVLGELDISGFSEYLHPIEDGKILAVGQEADDQGQILGLQITLFNASDPADLTLIDRLVIEQDSNTYSSSSVSWEPRAFRYFTASEDLGILIIPLNMYSYGKDYTDYRSFEGFAVFSVENDQISRRFDIDHNYEEEEDYICDSWCGWLTDRSFVINGDIITMKDQSIVSTDLATESEEWSIDARRSVCCA